MLQSIFDSLDDEDLRHARYRSNPYETIGSVIFLNRAAVKMANIDAVFDFNFTNPKKQNGEDAVDNKEILYFADVCAGPGGFSEYVLYRKGWRAKGNYTFVIFLFVIECLTPISKKRTYELTIPNIWFLLIICL